MTKHQIALEAAHQSKRHKIIIDLLVAAGHVSQATVDEASRIADSFFTGLESVRRASERVSRYSLEERVGLSKRQRDFLQKISDSDERHVAYEKSKRLRKP